jgi:diguanylate cyclase (GGDEF)-like protein
LQNTLEKKLLKEFLHGSLQTIRDTIRSYDTIGHYHDDEFLILFPETVSEQMPGITDRLLNAINRFECHNKNGKSSFSVTLGVVTCLGYTEEDTLLTTADEMLRQATLEDRKLALFSFVT